MDVRQVEALFRLRGLCRGGRDNRLDTLNTLRENIEEVADKDEVKNLLEMLKNLEEKTREMKQDGTDEKEAAGQALRTGRRQFNRSWPPRRY